jgi:orotidine-5'-phosphate decarboxylase
MLTSPADPIIVALDFDSIDKARQLIDQLGAEASFYKIGLQLLTAEGPSIVKLLIAEGKEVFLDLKLLEIPNSVTGAVSAAGELGVSMVTVHASGGINVLRAAVEAARPFPNLKIIAVTVITNMEEQHLAEIDISGTVGDHVLRLAKLAAVAGCHGVVASAQEAEILRDFLPSSMLIVTPGIQLQGVIKNDQTRTATPSDALRSGSSHLVIGRAITKSQNPRATLTDIRNQIAVQAHRT